MRIRPGTKHLGSSLNDTGAAWVEFVAATDDTALVELTDEKMRVWIDDALLARPHVSTTVTLSDTGWADTSTGGKLARPASNALPTMTAATTNGVTISADFENITDTQWGSLAGAAYKAADGNPSTFWADTGFGSNPTAVSRIWTVDFGAGNSQNITTYTIQAGDNSTLAQRGPTAWGLQRSTDGLSWTTEDTQGSEGTWSSSERKTYAIAGADTGATEYRYWRLNSISSLRPEVYLAEVEMFPKATSDQVIQASGQAVLNARAIGSLARFEKRVVVDTGVDAGVEHSLALNIERGPIVLRCGSTQRDDDYIEEVSLGTGYHNLAFTPSGNFWVTVQSDAIVDRIIGSLTVGDTGTLEVPTFLNSNNLDNVRYDQSADVV
jgi:hypothetical protein